MDCKGGVVGDIYENLLDLVMGMIMVVYTFIPYFLYYANSFMIH